MLLGRPPFETTNLKETYRCIREARYSLPSSLLAPAKHLIASMLSKNPEDRPSLDEIIRHEFFLQVCIVVFWLKSYPPLECPPNPKNTLYSLKFGYCVLFPQGFTPDRLSASCCHTVPDFHLSSPAKNFFKKAAAALFGGKKDKARYFDTQSKWTIATFETYVCDHVILVT